jgi:peroxiredoxin
MKALFLALAAALTWGNAAGMDIAASPEAVRPLSVGSQAPVSVLSGAGGSPVDLASLFAAKPTILIFFRGGWCPFCNRHLASIASSELELRQLGYQIVAISPDPLSSLESTANNQHLHYRLLSDRGLKVAAAYKVAFRISAADEKNYRENGIQLPQIPGDQDYWLPVPTAFIVGRDGNIKFVYFSPDPSVTISSEALLAAAKIAAGPTP